MMETFPVDIIEEVINTESEPFESTLSSEDGFTIERDVISEGESSPHVTVEISEETTTESHEEIFESQGEILEEDASATYEEMQTSSATDYTPILDALSVTNGLLTCIVFILVAQWTIRSIQRGIRRLGENGRLD